MLADSSLSDLTLKVNLSIFPVKVTSASCCDDIVFSLDFIPFITSFICSFIIELASKISFLFSLNFVVLFLNFIIVSIFMVLSEHNYCQRYSIAIGLIK